MDISKNARSGSSRCHALPDDLTRSKSGERRMHADFAAKVEAEVDNLITAGFIREIEYPIGLVNIVPTKKKNRQTLVCIDFGDLNKACPRTIFWPPHGVTHRMR